MSEIRRIGFDFLRLLKRWVDSHEEPGPGSDKESRKVDMVRTFPFLAMHVAILLVFWVGWSPIAVTMAVALYVIRMFAITGFYHRYFSHRTFKTSRGMQFVFALMGASAVQRGPLWWAANHRLHHAHSDRPTDVHSPAQHGLWGSHIGWFLTHGQLSTKLKRIKDFSRFPELRFLDRFDTLVPLTLAVSLFLFGEWLETLYPSLGTNGWQMLVWGFVVSTVALWHGTFTINSLSHRFGSQRYATGDESRNNFLLALLTLGEGWHNNHHRYPSATRQGFRWWEIDITYYLLKGLQLCGLIWDIRPVPASVLNQQNRAQIIEDPDSEQIAV
ncbi:MAG: acyl-CoA desaturase [Nitrospirales bacterium]|nr:acyl-CoA desaturase [Nitrospirales bacterium]